MTNDVKQGCPQNFKISKLYLWYHEITDNLIYLVISSQIYIHSLTQFITSQSYADSGKV